MIDAIVAGHLCIDIIPTFPRGQAGPYLVPGHLTEVGAAVISTGGAVSNTGLSLARLGMDVRLVARLGTDRIGGLTRDIVTSHGAHLADSLTSGAGPSSYTIVISPPGVDRTFLHCPGTNDTFGPEDVPDALLAGARLLHLGYPPLLRRMYADGGVELAALLRRAQRQGATTSLDLSLPDAASESGRADWTAILARALPHVDVFLPSAEELCVMLEPATAAAARSRAEGHDVAGALTASEVAALAGQALDMGARVVGLKMGDRGLYLRTARGAAPAGRGAPAHDAGWLGRELWAPCFRVPVVSTVGSGDATIAGFLAALLRGLPPEDCLTAAVAVGACNVEGADATSTVRGWDETQRRIACGWERLDARIGDAAWIWDAAAGLWRGPRDARRA